MRRPKELLSTDGEGRAVSPVIGVILMVAITVILAAVIATFVIGLGDSTDSVSPSPALDSEPVTYTLNTDSNGTHDVKVIELTVDRADQANGETLFINDQPLTESDDIDGDLSAGDTIVILPTETDWSDTVTGADDSTVDGQVVAQVSPGSDEFDLIFEDGDTSDTVTTFDVPDDFGNVQT